MTWLRRRILEILNDPESGALTAEVDALEELLKSYVRSTHQANEDLKASNMRLLRRNRELIERCDSLKFQLGALKCGDGSVYAERDRLNRLCGELHSEEAKLLEKITELEHDVAEAESALWRVQPDTHTVGGVGDMHDPFEGPGETYKAAYERLRAYGEQREKALKKTQKSFVEYIRKNGQKARKGKRQVVEIDKDGNEVGDGADVDLRTPLFPPGTVTEQVSFEEPGKKLFVELKSEAVYQACSGEVGPRCRCGECHEYRRQAISGLLDCLSDGPPKDCPPQSESEEPWWERKWKVTLEKLGLG